MLYTQAMRTTVNIDEALLVLAKRIAAERSMTLGEFVESAVQREIGRAHATDRPTVVELPLSPSGGYLPGVELSNRGLFDAADADGGPG